MINFYVSGLELIQQYLYLWHFIRNKIVARVNVLGTLASI